MQRSFTYVQIASLPCRFYSPLSAVFPQLRSHPCQGIVIRERGQEIALCTGHDESELDHVSSLPGSAQDLTWTAVLPQDGTVPVSAVGPTFWWGGTVTDPNTRALFGQAFLEVQFYPDGVVKNCTPGGGFNLTSVPNAFSVCAPVWQVDSKTFAEHDHGDEGFFFP